LFIADDISKIDNDIGKVFHSSDFQLCAIYASRNFESKFWHLWFAHIM